MLIAVIYACLILVMLHIHLCVHVQYIPTAFHPPQDDSGWYSILDGPRDVEG